MEIKKTTLLWSIPIVVVVIIIGVVVISSKVKDNKKERARQELRDDIDRRIDREYRNLKSSFDYYAEIACDWDRSEYSRDHAAKKMRELTDISWHDNSGISVIPYVPSEMKRKISEKSSEIKQALRSKAREKVREEYWEN